ncbi:MAG: 6-bladed beta-propeller [bacterium]
MRQWQRLCCLSGGIAILAVGQHVSAASAPLVAALGDYQYALHAPGRLATDANAHLFITDPQANQVVVTDIFGRTVDIRTGFATPLGIAIDGTGNIYLGEEGTGSVSVFDPQWNLLYKLGQGDGEFLLPNHIATALITGGGTVYVADSRAGKIKAYTNGVLSLAFGSQGTNPGELDFPTGIFVTTNREIYVVDQNNNRIQIFNQDGIFLRMFSLVSGIGGILYQPGGRSQGITVDSLGRVYVADSYQATVRIFDGQGALLSTLGTFGSGIGQFRSPTGLAIDRYNRLFVASANNSRVEVLGLDSFTHFIASQGNANADWKSTVTYSVITGGVGPFTYQWQKNGQNLADGTTISGSTNATLILTGVTLEDIGNYSVTVSSPAGVVSGASTYLMVNQSHINPGSLIIVF